MYLSLSGTGRRGIEPPAGDDPPGPIGLRSEILLLTPAYLANRPRAFTAPNRTHRLSFKEPGRLLSAGDFYFPSQL